MPIDITWPVAIAMLAFIAVSVVAGSALAGGGGWRSLASRYPTRAGITTGEERYRFCSMRAACGGHRELERLIDTIRLFEDRWITHAIESDRQCAFAPGPCRKLPGRGYMFAGAHGVTLGHPPPPGSRCIMARRDAIENSTGTGRRGAASWLALVGWLAAAAAAGAIGGIASRNAGDFYGALAKPAWAPPGWLFGPVWTTLYVMMGVAAWLVWRARPPAPADRAARRRGLVLFGAQLGLNALWTWLFFAWRQGAAAFAEILLLWAAVAATMSLFNRVRPPAAWLLAPYLAWISFAAALTWAVWQRNPGQL